MSQDEDSIKAYLQAIGKIPFLEQWEELELSHQVRAYLPLRDALAQLSNELGREPTHQEIANATGVDPASVPGIMARGSRARARMIEANLRLCVAVAKKYLAPSGMPLLDLIGAANEGLVQGVEKFDPTRGYRFSTYAYWWIRQSVTRAIQNESRVVRLPVHIYESIGKLTKVLQQARQEGKILTTEELCQRMKMTPEQLRTVQQARQRVGSLNTIPHGGDSEIGERIYRIGPDSPCQMVVDAEKAERQIQMQQLKSVVSRVLSGRHYEVVSLRYGLDDGQERTLTEVGDALGLSRQRVQQLERRAMADLRRSVAIKGFAKSGV